MNCNYGDNCRFVKETACYAAARARNVLIVMQLVQTLSKFVKKYVFNSHNKVTYAIIHI